MKPHHDTTLWSLLKDGREASAVLRYIEGYGYEVRLLHDGELRQSRMFAGEGKTAAAWADEWREELEGSGWLQEKANDR